MIALLGPLNHQTKPSNYNRSIKNNTVVYKSLEDLACIFGATKYPMSNKNHFNQNKKNFNL